MSVPIISIEYSEVYSALHSGGKLLLNLWLMKVINYYVLGIR